MVFAIILAASAIFGIVIGITKKNKTLLIVSAIGLVVVVATWVYFYTHPY